MLLCKAYRSYKNHIPPEPGLFKAIFFNARKTAPEWVWVRMTSQPGDEGFALQYHLMPDEQSKGLVSCGNSSYNCVLKRSHDTIHMLGCLEACPASPDQLCLTGVSNKSMGNIAPELLQCCKGNILFIGHRAHLDMTSLRHIVDMMHMEYDKSLRQLGDKGKGYIPGVRINCIGDRLSSDRPSLEACKVTDGFYEKDENLLIWIVSKLGIDLFARTIPPALPWRNRSGGYKGLHHAWNFGFAQLNPSEWSAGLGSVYVARKDKKPLLVAHIAALMAYLYSIGSEQVQEILDSKESWNLAFKFDEAFEMHNDLLLQKSSKEGFERFWTNWMEEEGRQKYGDVSSPYAA
ncbi:hypothetical protein J4E86_004875 [Alternaria arbusti]|uniref:uncharacterized protein n=1 Tax=Alternaria arbusti TaxID=232088 RepID=UPI002220DA2E|nr:uncharacterized protein J4E86_004875 [Alternaria arbusti]KAI4957736.1 hypothetical protein J4E86_004875 [Alternaria arbusti]